MRNFLLVSGGGVLTALIVVFWLIRVDEYERGFYASEILLRPESVVESIDYSYYAKGKWEMVPLKGEAYGVIWEKMAGDRGSGKVDPEIVRLFEEPKVGTLAIYVRREVPYQKEGLNALFQQMQVAPHGDYYRIQVQGGNWIYFYHPAIGEILSEVKKYG